MGWRVYNDHEPLRFVVNRNAIFSMSIGEGQRYEYSRDESSWSELQAGVQYYVQRGNSLYVRALGENETCQGTRFALSGYYYPPGYLTFSLSGSIMSLLRGVGWRKDAPEYCFDGMFKGCVGLTDADVFGDI